MRAQINITVISGSSGDEFLSPNFVSRASYGRSYIKLTGILQVFDCVELFQ